VGNFSEQLWGDSPERDHPDVTALVDLEPGWVSCMGHARMVEGSEAADLNHTVYDSILTEGGRATIGRFLEAHEDTTIEITPSKCCHGK
jgi:hypothetical protein